MLVINRTPVEIKIGFKEAGRFEFQDTEKTVEQGATAFKLMIEQGDETTPIFFTTKDAVIEFLKSN